MRNNKAIKLLLAILIVSSTANAKYQDEFDNLVNSSRKMSAQLRAESLYALSQKASGLAEQCLNEIFLIARGKYGFAKTRSANTEERTIVAKASAAFKRLFPASTNPFLEQTAVGKVDDSMSVRITCHLTVLKEGFEHIAELLNVTAERSVNAFGIPMQFSTLAPELIAKPAVTVDDEDVKVLKPSVPPPPLPSSTVVASTVVSSGENGDEEELDMEEVMSGVFHQKKNSGSGGSPAPSPKPTASSTRLGGTGEVVLDETVGRRSSNVVLSAAAAGGGVNLEALQTIVQQPGVVETDADRIKREEAERASKVAQSGAAPGNKDGKSPPLAASTTVQGAGNKQTPPPESRRVKKGCSCRIC